MDIEYICKQQRDWKNIRHRKMLTEVFTRNAAYMSTRSHILPTYIENCIYNNINEKSA